MAQVTATTQRTVSAPADAVAAALADYTTTRPRILSEEFSDYAVHSGGTGAGTVAGWKLAATRKRVRDVTVEVSTPGAREIVERDRNSSMVTTWTVAPAAGDPDGASTVTVTSSWNGAGGIGGFFEKTFAPRGLARIYDRVLANLDATVAS